MHELLKHVLTERDLTRAGDIFAIPDADIVDDLNEVLKLITEISSRPDYCRNDRDQALIEICVTRVTSCIKETGTLEKYCASLVALLESCLHHNLMPLGHLRDDDPPHAKIASDIIACIVLVSFPVQTDKENYGNKNVMELFLPVAVQFLHKGNREISRHMARYLSLAAVHHAMLLKPHIRTIMDSIMSGNYLLCRTLSQLYCVCPEPLEARAGPLGALLSRAGPHERASLLALLEAVATRRPDAARAALPPLLQYHCEGGDLCICTDIMQVVVCVSRRRPSLVAPYTASIRRMASSHAPPRARALAAAALTHVGYSDKERALEALEFVLELLPTAESGTHAALLREATALCSAFPALFTDRVLNAVRATSSNRPKSEISQSEVNRTSGGVTIVKLGGSGTTNTTGNTAGNTAGITTGNPAGGYTRRKLGDSRSTGRLHAASAPHRSITRLNLAGGSVGGLHKSMTRLSSSQQINSQQANSQQNISAHSNVGGGVKLSVGGCPPRPARQAAPAPLPALTTSGSQSLQSQSISVNPLSSGKSTDALSPITSSVSIIQSAGAVAVISPNSGPIASQGSGPITSNPISVQSGPVTVTSRRANNTSVTMINSSNNSNSNHRISVFEPYPMRDTVQHFCEKHLDKIKAYMDNVSLRLPPPAKCTIEERRSKKAARLQFVCGGRGAHCLFARAPFALRTRQARVWVHLMFLALQARHPRALSSRDPTVASLKHCWDILKCENKTFLTLVTSAFPGLKEQEMVANELRAAGFFDVFEVSEPAAGAETENTGGVAGATWGCFLCTHPERALGFLATDEPVIEGQLQEKKKSWHLFRRWRTRYFTLSGAHLSCRGASGGESIDINQIRSVKVSRGARNIPKAFEIFTGEQTLILKPKDGKNAEQWAQCLSIAVAHSHARHAPAKANSLPARGLTLKSF